MTGVSLLASSAAVRFRLGGGILGGGPGAGAASGAGSLCR